MTLISPSTSAAQLETASAAVEKLFPEAIETLKDLVRIPGIAWEAFDASQLDKSAAAVQSLFEDLGVLTKSRYFAQVTAFRNLEPRQ